jgi:hypothetical protein
MRINVSIRLVVMIIAHPRLIRPPPPAAVPIRV